MTAIRRYNLFTVAAVLFFITSLAVSVYMEAYAVLLLPFAAGLFLLAWQQPRYFFFFLLLLIPVSVELQLSETLATDFPDEMMMIIMAVIVVFVSLSFSKYAIALLRHPLFVVVLIWFAWMLLTVWLSTCDTLFV